MINLKTNLIMKNILISMLTATALCVSATACGAIDNIIANADDNSNSTITIRNGNGRMIKGSGNLITRTMAAQKYSSVEASRGVQVILSENADQITISADDNFMDYVRVRVEGGTLIASIDNKLNSIQNPHITVTVPFTASVSSLKASSSAGIRAEGLITSDLTVSASSSADISANMKASSCTIHASSSADVVCAVQVARCEVHANSSADVTLTGRADTLDAEASSSADLNMRDFTSTDVALAASSSADLGCNLQTERCDVSGSSSADITLAGATKQLSVRMSSSAGLDAADFTATDCTVEASTSADVTVNASGELFRASAMTGASVTNLGVCTSNDITKSTGGSVSYNR